MAHGAMINTGSSAVLVPLGSPSLALQIVDADGAPVPLPPPSVPRADWPVATLAPGEHYSVEYPAFLP